MCLPYMLIASLAVLSSAPAAFAQPQDVSRTQQGPLKLAPTLPILYRHFLAYQLHLERKADDLKKVGRDGEDFRTHFQKVLGFSTPEFNKIHLAALDLDTKLATNDKAIALAVAAFRATLPKQPFSESNPLPPPPAALDTLFKQRDSLVQEEIDALHKSLSDAEVKKLEIFLQQDFSRAVTVDAAPASRQQLLVKPQPTSRPAQ